MEAYTTLLYLHILSLVFWIGTDIGVFVLAGFAARAIYSVDQRLLLLKVAMILDMFPRVFLVLSLPTGFQLASIAGLIPNGSEYVASVWLFSAVWFLIVLFGYFLEGKPLGNKVKVVEKIIQLTVFLTLVWIGITSLINSQPIIADWLAYKVLLYATVIAIIPLLEIAFMPAIFGFMALETEGSSAPLEEKIKRSMGFTYLWVLAIYVVVLTIAYIGVVKAV